MALGVRKLAEYAADPHKFSQTLGKASDSVACARGDKAHDSLGAGFPLLTKIVITAAALFLLYLFLTNP